MKLSFATLLILFLSLQTRTVFAQQGKLSNRDTICVQTKDYQSLVHNRDVLAEQRNLLVERVSKLQEDNINLNKSSASTQLQISKMELSDSISAKMYKSLQDDAETYQLQIRNNDKEIVDLNRRLKKARLGQRVTAFVGIALGATLAVLYITK